MKKLLISPVLFYIKFWARVALLIHKPLTVGIAGSVGKSSTRNALFAVLKSQGMTKTVWTNSETGVPLGILSLEVENYTAIEWLVIMLLCPLKIFSTLKYKYMVVEMGIDDPHPPKNMEYLLSIIKPDIAISLNVAATHTQQFEKLLRYKSENESKSHFLLRKIAEEDTKIISRSNCRLGIYNSDDQNITKALFKFSGNILTFGTSGDAKYSSYSVDKNGTSFIIDIKGQKTTLFIKNQALPQVYQELFAAVLLVAYYLKIDLKAASESIEKNFTLPKGRSSILFGKKNTIIIDSSYNSSKTAVFAFLDLLAQISKIEHRKSVFLMGDMRELGSEAEREHKEVAQKINECVDSLYCVGPLTKEYVIPNIKSQIETMWFEDAISAGEYMEQNLPEKAVVLVKGSQNQLFLEEAIKFILKDESDQKQLCRQTPYWMNVKKEFFETL